jgi:DNA-directed RNA polymerase specialized sigma24 family protein
MLKERVTDDLQAVECAEIARGSAEAGTETPETALIAKAMPRASRRRSRNCLAVAETLVLRYLRGLYFKGIAKVTAVPSDAVMSRLARARQRVMTTIAKDENDAAG